ncbi:GTPase activating protein [Actinomortierella ambigua]|uniref:GTPase-activating protein GYP7 n=1 Tax=Actinomortierella ambigua TaxID=1343610 RepID=A0A9P6PW85_9FUNG|nr:GTPase activating protein [Actinomortierella ambigua]
MSFEDDSLVAQMEELEMHQSPSQQPTLLFARPKVYVATSMDNRGDIPGFLTLTESTNKEYLLSWTPEAMIPDFDEEAYVDISSQGDHEMTSFIPPPRSPPPLTKNRRSFQPSDYAVSVPIDQIYSILVYPPRMRDRFGSIIVNLTGGASLPAFMFLDEHSTHKHPPSQQQQQATPAGPPTWGGQELVDTMEGLVDIVGSAIEPGVYLVNASHADKVNHGCGTPPPSPLPHHSLGTRRGDVSTMDQDQQDQQRLYPRLDHEEVEGGANTNNMASLGTQSPSIPNTAFATATGAITREGMRRRRSISNHDGSSGETSANEERGQLLPQQQQQQQQGAASSSLPRLSPVTVSSSSGTAIATATATTATASTAGTSPHQRSRTPMPFEQHMDPLMSTVKEMRWNILERFSQVARFSRETATNLLDHPLTKTILPPHVQQRIAESEAARKMMEDYDSARVYLAKWAAVVADQSDRERREQREMDRLGASGGGGSSSSHHHHHHAGHRRISDIEDEEGPLGAFNVLDLQMEGCNIQHTRTGPLTPMDWFSLMDEDGRLNESESKIRERVFRGGVDHDIRIEVWKFFLGIYPWDSTEAERVAIRAAKAEEYFRLKSEWFEHPEVQESEGFQEQKLRIEKDVHRTDRTISFFASETLPNPSGDFTGAGSNENLELLKDILLTYNIWAAKPVAIRELTKDQVEEEAEEEAKEEMEQREEGQQANGTGDKQKQKTKKEEDEEDPRAIHLEGYVQGMSDLLAPVFAVMGDEVMGFWAFVGLMEKTKRNFYKDQVGMQSQLETLRTMIQILDPKLYKHLEKCDALNLFCCFRWLLIWFKREFEWVDIMRLWEVLFSDHLSTQFQLFVAMAILDKHRDAMMDHLEGFDEILKYVNDLSMSIDLEETLQNAEVMYRRLECIADKVQSEAASGKAVASSSSTTSRVKELPQSIKDLLTGPPLVECADEP